MPCSAFVNFKTTKSSNLYGTLAKKTTKNRCPLVLYGYGRSAADFYLVVEHVGEDTVGVAEPDRQPF